MGHHRGISASTAGASTRLVACGSRETGPVRARETQKREARSQLVLLCFQLAMQVLLHRGGGGGRTRVPFRRPPCTQALRHLGRSCVCVCSGWRRAEPSWAGRLGLQALSAVGSVMSGLPVDASSCERHTDFSVLMPRPKSPGRRVHIEVGRRLIDHHGRVMRVVSLGDVAPPCPANLAPPSGPIYLVGSPCLVRHGSWFMAQLEGSLPKCRLLRLYLPFRRWARQGWRARMKTTAD